MSNVSVVRNTKLDLLRTVAILCVLVIHSSLRYVNTPVDQTVGNWFSLFTRPTIAIFLFLAGYLFKITSPAGISLWHKAKRILVPYLIVSMLAFLYQKGFGFIDYVIGQPLDLIGRLLVGETWGIYYFVFVILCVYLLGFFVLTSPYLSRKILLITAIFFGLNIIHGALFPSLIQRTSLDPKLIALYENRSLLVWPCFFFFGLIFRQNNLDGWVDQHKVLVRAGWLVVFAVYNALFFLGVQNISGYDSVMGTLYSLSTIFFLLTFNVRSPVINFLSEKSYYIYLTHIFIVYGLRDWSTSSGYTWPYAFSLVSLLLSLLVPVALYFPLQGLLQKRTRVIVGG